MMLLHQLLPCATPSHQDETSPAPAPAQQHQHQHSSTTGCCARYMLAFLQGKVPHTSHLGQQAAYVSGRQRTQPQQQHQHSSTTRRCTRNVLASLTQDHSTHMTKQAAHLSSRQRTSSLLTLPVRGSPWRSMLRSSVSASRVCRQRCRGSAQQPGISPSHADAQVAVGHAQVAVGHAQVAVGHAQVAVGHAQVAVGHAQVAVGHAQVVVGHAQVAVGHAQVAVGHAGAMAGVQVLVPVPSCRGLTGAEPAGCSCGGGCTQACWGLSTEACRPAPVLALCLLLSSTAAAATASLSVYPITAPHPTPSQPTTHHPPWRTGATRAAAAAPAACPAPGTPAARPV
jgi:hypothetical protein